MRTSRNLAGLNATSPTDGFVAWLYRAPEILFYWYPTSRGFYEYLLTLNNAKRNFYETLRDGAKQRPRFDIDIYEDKLPPGLTVMTVLDDIIFGIMSAMTNLVRDVNIEDIFLYSSSGLSQGRFKYSYHIVIMKNFHNNSIEAKRFYGVVSEATHGRSRGYLDPSVYNSTQQFRAYGNTKTGDDRNKARVQYVMGQKTLPTRRLVRSLTDDSDDFFNSLLTNVQSEDKLIAFSVSIIQGIVCEEVEISIIKGLIPSEFVYDKFYPKYGYRFDRRKNVKANCIVCGRIHDSNGAYVKIIRGMAYFRCFADENRRMFALGPVSDNPYEELPENTKEPEYIQNTNVESIEKDLIVTTHSDINVLETFTTSIDTNSDDERRNIHKKKVRSKTLNAWMYIDDNC